jgi:hypothetical protein
MNKLIDHMNQRLDDDIGLKIKNHYKDWINFKIYEYGDIPEKFTDDLIDEYLDDTTDYKKKENIYKASYVKIYNKNFKIEKIKEEIKINNIIDIADDNNLFIEKILYDKHKNISTNEKKVLDVYKARAELLGVNYDKKLEKKKYKDLIIDDDEFTTYYIYYLLLNNDEIDISKSNEIKRKYNISNSKILLKKVKLIKQLEDILDIEQFNIDTDIYIDNFNNDVDIDDDIKNDIKKIFRSDRSANNYKDLYYQLIQMYKNVLGKDIFIGKQSTNRIYHYKFDLAMASFI